jgi:hypothetical protein
MDTLTVVNVVCVASQARRSSPEMYGEFRIKSSCFSASPSKSDNRKPPAGQPSADHASAFLHSLGGKAAIHFAYLNDEFAQERNSKWMLLTAQALRGLSEK